MSVNTAEAKETVQPGYDRLAFYNEKRRKEADDRHRRVAELTLAHVDPGLICEELSISQSFLRRLQDIARSKGYLPFRTDQLNKGGRHEDGSCTRDGGSLYRALIASGIRPPISAAAYARKKMAEQAQHA